MRREPLFLEGLLFVLLGEIVLNSCINLLHKRARESIKSTYDYPPLWGGRYYPHLFVMAIKKALISVSDKTGLDTFATGLHQLGVTLISTGGTCTYLKSLGLPVIEISDYTGDPELFDGRVKTLHPKVHGGLLQRRDSEEHQRQALENNIAPIDLVCVNLYPFEQTVAQDNVTLEEAIEKIDIGGPSMLRSAAKNYASVTVVCQPEDYAPILKEMAENAGDTTLKMRECLAVKVFKRTASYDKAISTYLSKPSECAESSLEISLPFYQQLRYGDNPHQKSALYGDFGQCFQQLQGKELSYTNILDIEAAAELISYFARPTVAILKHTNPCGIGQDDHDLREAWQKAYETDTQAPFGGVIIMNRPMTESLARVVGAIFTDVIIAPDFEPEARALLQKKKNTRLIKVLPGWQEARKAPIIRSAPGGLMVMDRDNEVLGLDDLESKVVTKRPPTQEELIALRFAWRVVKQVHSNAIVFASADRTLGIGAGQMSRVDSVNIAIWKAGQAELSLKGSVIASDAMFPFADGLQAAIDAGVTACIQPGGSIRDEEVIAAADAAGIAMIFTGHRHFLH